MHPQVEKGLLLMAWSGQSFPRMERLVKNLKEAREPDRCLGEER